MARLMMMSGSWAMTVSTSLACWAASKLALVSAMTSIPSSAKASRAPWLTASVNAPAVCHSSAAV